MELSKINVEIRERIKEVLGLSDGQLVKMNENDLLNELLDTVEFFDDEEKNKFIPRIRALNKEIEQLKTQNEKLKTALENSPKSDAPASVAPKAETKNAPVNSSEISKELSDLIEKNKKQVQSFLKKKLAVIENGDLESIHPKQKELEEEVLMLAKENSELNSLIMDDMDLIDSLMLKLKENNIDWKHSLIEKRAHKLKTFDVGYQPFGRLFLYKKLMSIPQLELVKS